MINSVYTNIDIYAKAADAAWLRNDAISNNIANVDTPGYKRQDVSFETQLERALTTASGSTVRQKIRNLKSSDLEARPYTDYANYSYRLDGNNVDIDTENVELAANQIKYNGLMQIMSGKFNSLKSVMG
ncbi:MAG: flagellar basal body rod protein FlgB [Lachnospiraceae bacterium]